MKSLPPIVIFCYNRPEHLKNTINSLLKNNNSEKFEYIFFCDGPKLQKENDLFLTKEVQQLVNTFSCKKQIIISETNKGLAKSVIDGLNTVFKTNETAIVIEDDLIFTSDFLDYITDALIFYKNKSNVFSVSGYSFPIGVKQNEYNGYFSYRFSSWAWATWKDRWDLMDWDLTKFKDNLSNKKISEFSICGEDYPYMLKKQFNHKIDSWAIRFVFNSFINGGVHYFPFNTRAANTGLDGSGTHSKSNKKLEVVLNIDNNLNFASSTDVSNYTKDLNVKYFKRTFIKKAIRFIRDSFNI